MESCENCDSLDVPLNEETGLCDRCEKQRSSLREMAEADARELSIFDANID